VEDVEKAAAAVVVVAVVGWLAYLSCWAACLLDSTLRMLASPRWWYYSLIDFLMEEGEMIYLWVPLPWVVEFVVDMLRK
jgi:hypothetical protein